MDDLLMPAIFYVSFLRGSKIPDVKAQKSHMDKCCAHKPKQHV